jgi:2-polyprenyl-3-methyl-5-hydroxy-6-metoxy-1,4-benzoquinol methylase
MKCRFCSEEVTQPFATLGSSPASNSYLTLEELNEMEPYYPLNALVCSNCFLVQLDEFKSSEDIFSDYAYFSSYSTTWLEHAKTYVSKMIEEFNITPNDFVVEIASNDGYLLQYFKEKNITILGIEPATNVADVAIAKGIPTDKVFFDSVYAKKLIASVGQCADLIIGNNVLAHVPNLNDFVEGLKILLSPTGIITLEFPHLMRLVESTQFDTIYHEHFSYFSLLTVTRILDKHDLRIFDVEELSTHGGSLRIYVCHKHYREQSASESVIKLIRKETKLGYNNIKFYSLFNEKIKLLKREILSFLIQLKNENKTIVGYGAPAKGNTLLNYCGIRTDFIDYTCDLSPYKQGLYLPGSRIPIANPDRIKETKPDYVLILPWNLKDEIMKQLSFIREWDGKFITLVPHVEIL